MAHDEGSNEAVISHLDDLVSQALEASATIRQYATVGMMMTTANKTRELNKVKAVVAQHPADCVYCKGWTGTADTSGL
jgi:hypothetical protein